jgi:hypothetical protein
VLPLAGRKRRLAPAPRFQLVGQFLLQSRRRARGRE